MRQPLNRLVALAILLLLTPGCKRQDIGSATEKASAEYAQLQEELMGTLQAGEMTEEEAREIDELLQHFSRTADPRYATKRSGLTLLHLACLYKHAELVKCLLADGASPHATLKNNSFFGFDEPDVTPLLLAVSDVSDTSAEQNTRELVEHLLNAGATVNMHREGQNCTHESTYLTLLNKAANLEDTDGVPENDFPVSVGKIAAENGWHTALAALLARRGNQLTEGDKWLLHMVSANNSGSEEYVKCARFLLQNGSPVNLQDNHGVTPLFALTTGLSFQQDEDGLSAFPLAELLLQHGADVNLPAETAPEFPGFTPMDFLMTKPELLKKLRDNGYSLQPPPIQWDSDSDLPREICRAYLKETAPCHHHSTQLPPVSPDTAEHFSVIAGILQPDATMRQHPLYPEALSNGIILMSRIDSGETSRLLAKMPIWTDALVWKNQHPHALGVLQVLTETPSLILPAELICAAATIMEEQQQYDFAASMMELLSRCPNAETVIAHYEQYSEPSLRAGALQAKLLRNGLPAARCYAVRDWLEQHGIQAESPILKKAILLTSQEDIWLGKIPKEQVEQILQAMEEVGALRAAKAYRAIAAALHDAAQLDAITADSHIWKFELECATALFILQHADHFLHSSSPEQKNTD